ncbi:MAG: hypothetical protein NTY13_00200 [Chlamydiae bacterium]|nr:hypothetical protein [Chlamydiota bacterium]
MKKLLVLFAGLTCHSLYASPVLSPNAASIHTDGVFFSDDCSCWSLRAGFRGDYVFDRKLSTNQSSQLTMECHSIFANEAVLTFNLWDRLDIYGLVGAATQSLFASHSFNNPSVGDVRLYGSSSSKTIWGVGARTTILEHNFNCCGTSYLGADINYENIGSSYANTATWNGAPVTTFAPLITSYEELQVSVQVGHRISILTPYIGAKWSNARSNSLTTPTANHKNHWGYAVGVLLIDAGRMSVTAEARFIDEKAMTIMGEFRF